jgi:hypothetical protein
VSGKANDISHTTSSGKRAQEDRKARREAKNAKEKDDEGLKA